MVAWKRKNKRKRKGKNHSASVVIGSKSKRATLTLIQEYDSDGLYFLVQTSSIQKKINFTEKTSLLITRRNTGTLATTWGGQKTQIGTKTWEMRKLECQT